MVDKIDKLEKELYGSDDEPVKKRMRRRVFFPGSLQNPPTRWYQKIRTGKERHVAFGFKAIRFSLFAGAGALMLGGVIFLVLYYLNLQEREAFLAIHARESVESGEILTIPFAYENRSRAILKDVELIVVLPQDSVVIIEGVEQPAPPQMLFQLDDLEPGGEGVVEIITRAFGRENEEKKIEATLLYRPENLRPRFTLKEEQSFLIRTVPLSVTWEFPEVIPNNREFEVRVLYASSARAPFEDLSLFLEFPDEFEVISREPDPDIGDGIWRIGTLNPGIGGIITLRGNLTGEEGEAYVFRGGMGVFNASSVAWSIYTQEVQEVHLAVTPLVLNVLVNDARDYIITPGETIRVEIEYQNNTSDELKNVLVRALLEEHSFLDLLTLDIENNGFFDFESRSIIWGPGSTRELRDLAPGEGGKFSFRIDTRERPIMRSAADKNLIIHLKTAIEQAQAPEKYTDTTLLFENFWEYQVNSLLLFTARSLYHQAPIPNFGPLPPRVGLRTSYNIVWEVRNFTNDLEDMRVRTFLPTNMRWEGHEAPPGTLIQYNEASGEIVWDLGTVPAGTGVIRPALLAAYRGSFIPSELDVGLEMRLTDIIEVSARDEFTDNLIRRRENILTTKINTDELSNSKDWHVVE